jgi:hypothetical protein
VQTAPRVSTVLMERPVRRVLKVPLVSTVSMA